jgi:dTDP-4-dehydrorhamnose reductase
VERFQSVNVAETDQVVEAIHAASEGAVVNFAARTDVDNVERERPTPGTSPRGDAWAVNALAAGAMAETARATGKHFVQISTDFVFDGFSGPYPEDFPVSGLSDRLNWYGWTKGEGERLVLEADPSALIVRIAFPYRVAYPSKVDFARWMLARHREGRLPPLFSDQQITPTWIPDVTEALGVLIPQRASGIVHIASPVVTSPFEFGCELLSRMGERTPAVVAGSISAGSPVPGRAPRPIRGGLRTSRASQWGIPLTSWRSGIEQMARGLKEGA